MRKIGAVKYTDSVWNEMQRDAMPDYEDCPKCGRVMAKDVWLTDKVEDIRSYCPICKRRLDNIGNDIPKSVINADEERRQDARLKQVAMNEGSIITPYSPRDI